MKTKFIKKLMAMALVVCMGCAIVGCGEKSKEEDDRTTYEILKELDINEYITLGEYKGLELEKSIIVVTQEDVEHEIQGWLETFPVDVTDRTEVKKGDTVKMDYVGRMDGKEFSGGSATDAELVIGSEKFIDGFEDGLIGATVGKECVLELKFPDPYPNNSDLAGKPVEFTVTVKSIKAPLEEPTDEWVVKNVEKCSTVAEFKETIEKMLKEANDLTSENQLAYDAWSEVVEGSEIHKYPEVLVERGKELYREEIETYIQYYGMDLDDYLEFSGITKKEYEEYATEYGESIAAQGMINYAICQIEGFEIGSDKFNEELKSLAEEYDCTEEELYKKYKQDDVEQTVLLNIVCDWIVENAKVTEVESSEKAE